MTNYLNIESIRNAADLVNATLLAKGYTSEKLLFSSINWAQIIADQPEKDSLLLENQDIVYNNDKNIINIIYSLCETIDKTQEQNKTFNKKLADTENTLRECERKLAASEAKNGRLEQKIEKSVFETQTLKAEVKALERAQRGSVQDSHKLRSLNSDLQAKYDVEMRKKAVEISLLKDKLLDLRNLSNTLSYGKPSLKKDIPETNPNIVHQNKAIFDNKSGKSASSPLDSFVSREYEKIAAQLSDLIENLMAENSRYSKFVADVSQYFHNVNAKISPLGLKSADFSGLPSPSDYIDVNKTPDANSEIQPFQVVTRPLLSNIYSNFHNVLGLVEALSPQSAAENDSRKTVLQLVQENQALHQNWQDAMKALDEWKRYSSDYKRRKGREVGV